MVLSSIVVVLVSSTFLVQNQYYATQTQYVGAHENARAMTERLTGELRLTMDDGIVVAGRKTLTVRSPIALAAVCNRLLIVVDVHVEGGAASIDSDEVAGIALRDELTGDWNYQTGTWSFLDGGSTLSAGRCGANAADTSWAQSEFHTLNQLNILFGALPDPGDLLMLYRETTFQILPSVLEAGSLGLFRQSYGASPVEFATGMDSTAQFQYRTGGATYADTIFGPDLADIDAIRIVADARKPAPTGGRPDVTFGWSVNIALRHAQ